MADYDYAYQNGAKIRELLDKKGLTQDVLAENIHVDARTIIRYEKNQVDAPFEKILEIAKTLECPVEDLIFCLKPPVLVCRDNELALLKKALEQARSGRGCTLWIRGERGTGKTHLVHHFRQTVLSHRLSDLFPVSILCLEASGELQPFRDLVHKLVPQESDVQGFWSRDQTGDALSTIPSRGASSSEQIGIELLEIVKGATRGRTLLLVFEDIHRMSQQSLRLLRQLALYSRALPMLMICEYRASAANDCLHMMISKLEGAGSQIVPIEPFSRDCVIDYLRKHFGKDWNPPTWFIDDLFDWSGGVPFYLDLRIRSLRTAGALIFTDGGPDLQCTKASIWSLLPRDAGIIALLTTFDKQAHLLLEIASIEGRRFHPRIASVVANLSNDDVEVIFNGIGSLSGHPNPAIDGHLKSGHWSRVFPSPANVEYCMPRARLKTALRLADARS